MAKLVLLAGAAAALAAVLANIGIWSPRKLWVKLTAVAATAAFLPITYLAMSELLSHPKPVEMAWAERNLPEAKVIASHVIEDQAIFLWLGFDDGEEPRAYVLPWIQAMAQQLEEAKHEAESSGTGVMVSMPFERTQDRLERMFYAAPQAALPPKQAPQTEPLVLRGPDTPADAFN